MMDNYSEIVANLDTTNNSVIDDNSSLVLHNLVFNIKSVLPPTWTSILYICMSVFVMTVAVLGNGLIIIVEQFNRSKTSTDWLVYFMSVYDLIIAVFDIPMYIIIYCGMWKALGSTVMCQIVLYAENTMSYASTLTLSLIAIDRCIKTCRPHSVGVTTMRSKRICFGITTFTLLIGIPRLFSTQYDEVLNCKYTSSDDWKIAVTGFMYIIQASFLFMFITVAVCYFKIAYVIRRKIHLARRTIHPIELLNRISTPNVSRFNPAPNTVNRLDQQVHHDGRLGEASATGNERVKELTLCSFESYAMNVNPNIIETIVTPLQGSSNYSPTTDLTRVIETNTARYTAPPVVTQAEILDKKVNKTTIMMFAVTIVFMLSWIPPWIVASIWPTNIAETVSGNVIIMFTRRAFVINTCTNPLFFIGMSTAFRQKTKTFVLKIWNRLKKCVHI